MLGKEEAVFPIFDKILAATLAIGDDRAAGSEGFDSSDTERFEAGKEVGFGILQILGEFALRGPG